MVINKKFVKNEINHEKNRPKSKMKNKETPSSTL